MRSIDWQHDVALCTSGAQLYCCKAAATEGDNEGGLAVLWQVPAADVLRDVAMSNDLVVCGGFQGYAQAFNIESRTLTYSRNVFGVVSSMHWRDGSMFSLTTDTGGFELRDIRERYWTSVATY